MPIVNVPGVGNVQFPDDMSEKDISRTIERDILKTGRTGFTDALSAGLEGLVGAGAGIGLGLSPNNQKLRAAVEASQQAQADKYTGPSFQDVENAFTQDGGVAGLKSLYQFGKGAIGQSLPYMAAPLAGGRLGAMAGGALAGPVGAAVGGIGGAGLASAAQFFGTNVGRQVQEGEQVNPGAAALAAIPQAALDVGTLKFAGLGRIFGMEGKKAAEEVTKDIVTSYRKGIPLHMVKGLAEIPTEVAQQVLERAQAGKDLTGQDAFDEYKASAAAAGLMGPAMGTVGGISEVRGNRQAQAQLQAQQAQEAAAQAASARQEDLARRTAFGQQMDQMNMAALAQRMDELREGSNAYAPLNAAIRERQAEQARADQQKAAQSALSQNQPDLFGNMYPEQQVSQVVTPEQTAQPQAQPGQMTLPFEEEGGQRTLFPEMMGAQQTPSDVVEAPASHSYPLSAEDFNRFGISKAAGIRKRLNGVDIMTREGRNKFAKEIEKFDNGQRTANWDELESFMKGMPPLEQDVLGLEGGFIPTQANNVMARNTEAPQAAVRQRYDASGQRIIPKGPRYSLAQQEAIARERARREFMFGGQQAAPAPQTEPNTTNMLIEGDQGGQDVHSGHDAGASEPSVGVPVQSGEVPAQVAGVPDGRAVDGAQRDAGADNGREAVRVGALTEPTVKRAADFKDTGNYDVTVGDQTGRMFRDPESGWWYRDSEPGEDVHYSRRQIGFTKAEATEAMAEYLRDKAQPEVTPEPTEKPVRKGGRPKMAVEDTADSQVSQALGEVDQPGAFPAVRQAAINRLYQIATDNPDSEAGKRAAERLDADDITTEQTKVADKAYRRSLVVKENAANNPDKFGAPLPSEVLGQPTNGQAALSWLESNAKNGDVRKIAAIVNRTVDLSNVRTELASPDDPNVPQALRERLETSLGLYGSFANGDQRVFIRDDGQNELTLLHELVHAATHARLKNPNVLAQFKGLMKQVERAAEARYSDGKEKIPESVRFFGTEALTDPDEFVAYGFSSPTFRAWLDSMAPKANLWQKFVDTVKRIFGIQPAQAQTFKQMMDALLEPTLQTEAPAQSADQTAKASKEAASPTADLFERTKRLAPPDDSKESFFDKVVDKVGKVGSFFFDPAERESMIESFRNKTTFYGAAVENRLQKQYNGAIMDAMGNVRPDINLLQALHADNLGAATLFKGRLTLDKDVGGWWKAVDDEASMSKVFQQVHALEQKIGEDEARHATQVFLLAARSDALNKANADIERQALQLEGRGKKKEAEKLRDEKLKHVHLTDDEIAAGLEYGKIYPELRGILDTYTKFKNNLIDSMVEAGRFGKEQAADLKAAIDYVPFHRIQEEEQKPSGQREYFRGLTDLGKLYKFTGSEKPVDNILDNMVQMSMWMVNNAVRNHAAVRLADAFGARNDKGELILRDVVAPGKGAVSVPIFKDGKRKFIEVGDPLEAEAFKGVEPVTLPIVTALGKFSNLLRKGTTSMPNFLVSQVIQDSMRAATLSGVKSPFNVAGKTMSGFVSALGGKDPVLNEMEAYGISGAYDYTPGAAKEKAERELGLKRRTAVQKVFDLGENLAAASDAAQRRAIYDQTMKEGGDKALALYRAMEIINFKRQGSNQTVNIARRLVPFMNAYLQGMDVLARTFMGKGVAGKEQKEAMGLFWRAGMKVAALSLLYSMMVSGDDEYEKQDDRTKARNFFIPGTGVKLPVPADVGFFFKVIPELAYRYIANEGTNNEMDADKLRKAIATSAGDALLGPTLVPQAIKPFVEVGLNHSFFTGNPIVGRGLEKKETSQQFTENTSEVAKFIGQSGLVSPMNVDYLVRGVLGSVGAVLLTGMDSMAGVVMDNPRPTAQAHKNPFLGTFLTNPEGRGLLSDYYDLKEQSDKTFATLQSYIEQRDLGKAKEYLQENKELLATRGVVGTLGQQIEKLRALRKNIIADASLSADQKRAKLDEIDATQNRMLANIAKIRKASGL